MNPETEKRALDAIADALLKKCGDVGRTLETMFGSIVRNAIDEVVDGPRTGRWSIEQLTNPEKTYVGTKVEILLKTAFDLARSVDQDALIAGYDVNIKWSKSLVWMIGQENIGSICLGLGTSGDGRKFSVGLFAALRDRLKPGRNRDQKGSLAVSSLKQHVRWLVRDAELPRNFVESLPTRVRDEIFAEKSAQRRLRKLAELVPGVPIPRDAIRTVAMDTDDPLRRVRKDRSRAAGLGGMTFLSAKYGKSELRRRGLPPLAADHFIAVPDEIE